MFLKLVLLLAAFGFLLLKGVIAWFVKHYKEITTPDDVPDRTPTIKCLQYNVDWCPSFCSFGREMYMTERMNQFAAAIKDYDIVCLEGAYQMGSDLVTSFVKICRGNGLRFVLSGDRPSGLKVLDSGLLILSKYPVAAYEYAEFKAKGSIFAQEGAIYCKLRTSALEFVHVVVTNLTKSKGKEPAASEKALRRKQQGEVVALIKRHVTDTLPLFVFGDFGIDGRNGNEYDTFKDFKIEGFTRHDILHESLNEHPVTFGDTDDNDKPRENVLTEPEFRKAKASVDYIFHFKTEAKDWVVDSVKGSVEKFAVGGRQYTQLASHYGVEATITVTKI
jgi:endonuclease/exonuclease/phosphatase family metal-dependent hydrolase